VGHGLNLFKHSYMFDIIKEKNICIENNPLSNQILGYVEDMRLHPLICYLNYGIKVSVSSDDDGVFNSSFLNWDFISCLVSIELNLLDLKKLCENSIECSCLEKDVKEKLYATWKTRWDMYIKYLTEAQSPVSPK